MIHSFDPKDLASHTEQEKTQAVLFSLAFDTVRGIIDSPVLSLEAKHALVITAANYFLDTYVKKTGGGAAAPGGAIVDIDQIEKSLGEMPIPIAKAPTVIEPEVAVFNDLMKSIIAKNKGRKTSRTLLDKANIEKLVNIIDSYKGAVKIMQTIKDRMNKSGKETPEQKSLIIQDFVRSII